MDLWIFNHYAVTPDLSGGTRHFDLAKELVKRGWQVVIFASSFHHSLHRDVKLPPGEPWRLEEVEGIKFVWLRTPPYQRNDWCRVRNMVVFMLRAWRLGRKLPRLVPAIGRPDMVIGSSVHLLAVLAAYGVAKHHKSKFLMEVRDLWPQTIIDMGGLSARHPITKALQSLERFLYLRAERIITLLPLAHEYITACGIPEEKIVWIPNGVDLSRFEGLKPVSAKNKRFTVMYLGAHAQANALDVLIQAAKTVQERGYNEIRFDLIGDGPEKSRLMAMAKGLGLRNVEFHDPVPKTEVPKILHIADATVFILNDLPLYRYGISVNKLFDYLAAGKPLILAGRPANNPVEEARCGLTVPPRDPEALAEAVIKLYEMPQEEREAMGRRGREYVEEHHDIRKLAQRLEEVLLEVIREQTE
jgi:glycosyltransferase involved in cell wall biosynthesis